MGTNLQKCPGFTGSRPLCKEIFVQGPVQKGPVPLYNKEE